MPSYTLFTSLLALAATNLVLAQEEKATFTHYGIPDSANCATTANACGPVTASGFTAAISQKQFGVGPGAGAGPGCGECWTLHIQSDETAKAVTQKSINVTVNNLCPISGNEQWCNVPNAYGGQVHFDLCADTGAAADFFTSSGSGIGYAEPCGSSSGSSPAPVGSSSSSSSSAAQATSSAAEASAASSSSSAEAYSTAAASSMESAIDSTTASTASIPTAPGPVSISTTLSSTYAPPTGTAPNPTTSVLGTGAGSSPIGTAPNPTTTLAGTGAGTSTATATATVTVTGTGSPPTNTVGGGSGMGWNATTSVGGTGTATGTGVPVPTGTSAPAPAGPPATYPPHCGHWRHHHHHPSGPPRGRFHPYPEAEERRSYYPPGPPSGYGPDGCPHWEPQGARGKPHRPGWGPRAYMLG
ncbi:MAG: hypothetical protein M1828_003668 [Chrysothrix sp. TS-e1954]|nr:MAG: hypothetical protein M1828_003668 [Chrysothrix sp. TS-e1954]